MSGAVQPESVITCVDCGGDAHLLTPPDDDGKYWPGEVIVYRCRDCRDRWDVVVGDASEYEG